MIEQEKKRPTTVIGLLRHGPTLYNAQKRIQGSCDSPLTTEGRQLVCQWASLPPMKRWHRIVVSPLGRAQETASLLTRTLKLTLHLEPRLQEQDWGEWEGRTFKEIESHSPGMLEQQVALGWDFKAPGGETRREVLHRVQEALGDLVGSWPGENILVVTHQGVIQSVVYHLTQRHYLPTEKKLLKKHGLHILHYRSDRFSIKALNLPLQAEV